MIYTEDTTFKMRGIQLISAPIPLILIQTTFLKTTEPLINTFRHKCMHLSNFYGQFVY